MSTGSPAGGQCFACDVNAGDITPPGGTVYQDALWQADHEVTPLVRGYMVFKPRRHVHELADLSADEAGSLGPAIRALMAAMRAALGPERIYVCSFAEAVHHLHFHLIPRYRGMPGLGPGLLPDVFAGRWRCAVEEAAAAADAVRSVLQAA